MGSEVSDRQLLDRIFETSPTGIVVFTHEGEITHCNNRAEELLQLTESDIEGKTYREPEWTFVDDEGDPIAEGDHPFVRVLESRGPIFSQEYLMYRPHADPIDLSISGAPIIDESGEIDRLVFAFQDITTRRERERELQVTNEQLEVLNRVVRHDIRNDMSVVIGWLEIIEGEVASERARQALDRVLQTSRHIVDITKTARDLVNVVAGDTTMVPEPVGVRPILENTVAVTRESHPEAEVRIEGEIPELDVVANDLLGSVIQNLLNNAIRHNDTDEPIVTVSVESTNDRVRLSVADNGPGVPEEQKWTIFGKGEKGLDSPGTGIGLFLVDRLVTQFGGDVWVEDNEPRGAVFVVELETSPTEPARKPVS